MAVELSVVIPAYNEAERLLSYLQSIYTYFLNFKDIDYEVIVVDDGSADQVAELIGREFSSWPELTIVRHQQTSAKARRFGEGCSPRAVQLFACTIRILVPLRVNDTQCGFKLFRLAFVGDLFAACSEKVYLFDFMFSERP